MIVLYLLVAHLWRRRHQTVGITVTYLAFFTVAYWFQGFAYALPWHQRAHDPAIILAGFGQSLIGFISFAFGILVLVPFLRNTSRKLSSRTDALEIVEDSAKDNFQLTTIYIVVGLGVYLFIIRIFGDIPTFGAFLSGIQRLYHIGILFLIWLTLKDGRWNAKSLVLIGALIIVWPFLTISRDGFLGFGLLPTTFLLVFLAFRFLKAKTVFRAVPFALYIGLSIVMTYFGERDAIRSVAWSGADSSTRINTVTDAFTDNFRAFNIFDSDQLAVIDARFTLNWLTGLGVQRLESGLVEFADGETIRDAFLMVVPRALWPDKPLVVGGQALVNQYAGVYMYGGTSVALGQVLEFYVNFGTIGVIIGFIILSIFLSAIDYNSAKLLNSNRLPQAAVWIVCAFSLWLVEDNLITAIGGAVSSVITIVVFNQLMHIVRSAGMATSDTRQHQLTSNTQDPISQ
jgi:hypothetical protein